MTSTLVLRLHRQLFAKRAVTWAIYQILPLNEQFCSASATSIWKWNHQTKDCVKYRKPCIRKSRNQSIKSVGMSLPSWCFLLFQMTKNVEWLLVIWYYINFQETVAKKSRSTKKQYDNSEEKFVECIKWCSVWCSLLDQIVLTSTTEMKIKHSNLISSRYFKSLKFRIFKKQ